MREINKIIDLIKKTGDKCIVLGEDDQSYVLMTLKDYEKLVLVKSEIGHLTEEELLDKINRDIAKWRAVQEDEKADEIDDFSLNLDKKDTEEELLEDDKFYFEPIG